MGSRILYTTTTVIISKVGEEHPSILEAAHNLAAAVHEEQSQGAGKEEERSTGGSYYLDEMSDEEMEEDGGGAPGPSRGQARARSSNSFNAITPAQLAQVWSNSWKSKPILLHRRSVQPLAAQVEVLHRVSRGSKVSLDLDQLLQGLCKCLLITYVFQPQV